ncbi:PQQ-dependent sugar dehydrogenase [Halostagnicola bangensis]
MSNQRTGEESASNSSNKRRLLQGIGGLGAIGLAGCADETDDDEEESNGGAEPDPDAATNWDNYSVTELDVHDNMMSMDVAPDGRVFYITRGATFGQEGDGTARVNYVDPDSDETGTALELPVRITDEDGGQGLVFDPDFEENNYVYIFYTPTEDATEDIGESPYAEWYDPSQDEEHDGIDYSYMLVSRFEMEDDEIDADTEEEIIRIPYQRDLCCHLGGYLEFGPEGELYISTGDDSNTFESDGFVPIDDQDARHPAFDAQRTSGNTADLRGKILRIIPEDDGSYSIPDDNLFTEDQGYGDEIEEGLVKPEIYVMGLRNPYTIAVDEETGLLHVADYGPDGEEWDSDRGPMGLIEYRQICEASNAGWPFFHAYYPYRRYDFETEESGQPFWPDNLRNDSSNNTGLEKLPPVTPADVWFPESSDSYVEAPDWVDMPKPGEVSWPEFPDGGSANTGPRYRHSDEFGEGALDPYFDGKQFIMAPFNDNWMGYLTYNDDGSVDVNEFLPDEDFETPNDMEYGPDGRLFLQTYGPGFSGEDGRIFMIEYEA